MHINNNVLCHASIFFIVQASYGVEDPEFAITQLAQTTMRSELGKISLDGVFRERESINVGIVGEFGDRFHCTSTIIQK